MCDNLHTLISILWPLVLLSAVSQASWARVSSLHLWGCQPRRDGGQLYNIPTLKHHKTSYISFKLLLCSSLSCCSHNSLYSSCHWKTQGKLTNYICIGVWKNTPIVCVYFNYWISYTLTFPLPLLKTAKKSCLFPVLSLGVSLTPVVLVIVSLLLTFSSSSLKPRA